MDPAPGPVLEGGQYAPPAATTAGSVGSGVGVMVGSVPALPALISAVNTGRLVAVAVGDGVAVGEAEGVALGVRVAVRVGVAEAVVVAVGVVFVSATARLSPPSSVKNQIPPAAITIPTMPSSAQPRACR